MFLPEHYLFIHTLGPLATISCRLVAIFLAILQDCGIVDQARETQQRSLRFRTFTPELEVPFSMETAYIFMIQMTASERTSLIAVTDRKPRRME